MPRLLTLSPPLAAMRHLPAMLDGEVSTALFGPADAILAWGDRWPSRVARLHAAARGLPVLRLEDGFIRSVGLGKAGAPTVSIIVDREGMHFDARAPSSIETLLREAPAFAPATLARAQALIVAIRHARIDKYNLAASPVSRPLAELPASPAEAVLTGHSVMLVDQVAGDRSIAGAGATRQTFLAMMHTAIATFGAEQIFVKSHPDVLHGHAEGNLTREALGAGILCTDAPFTSDDVTAAGLSLWTVSSTMGFEALLRGGDVTTFGMPFYAGWGLTSDRATGRIAERARLRRGIALSIEQMAAAVFFDYCRYGNPWTGARLEAEDAVELLAAWRNAAHDGQIWP